MKDFVERWKNHGYEKGESQKFWIDLLETLGAKNVLEKNFFEQQINDKDLNAAFEQAKFYDNELPFNKKSRRVITSDFQTNARAN